MIAKVKLSYSCVIPEKGLNQPRLRIELSEKGKEDSWISEILVLENLPWYRGESRKVEVRIMSDEFEKYVESIYPDLLVKRGAELVGTLTFCNS